MDLIKLQERIRKMLKKSDVILKAGSKVEKSCLNCRHCEFDGRYNDLVCYAADDYINECPEGFKPCDCWEKGKL